MRPEIMRKLAKPMLFGAAIIWGTSFFIMKNALDVMPVFSLLAVRFTAGALLLGLVCWNRWKDFSMDYLWRGAIIGAFLILLVAPMKALWFLVFLVILQQLEGNLIYPRVVGKSVGLPGIWVLAAVTVGGNAFGLVGMLVSVPICSVLYTIFREFVNYRLEKRHLNIE